MVSTPVFVLMLLLGLTVITCISLHQRLSEMRLERDDLWARLSTCRNALDVANQLNAAMQEELRDVQSRMRITGSTLTSIAATIGQAPTQVSPTDRGDDAAESTT